MEQLVTYKAVLGEKGAPNADGFGADPNSRPITIIKDSGEVVYKSRSGDTSKAADSHIRNAGYQREGEWAESSVSVIPIPKSVKNSRRLKALGVTAAVLLGLGGCTAYVWSQGTSESDAIDACNTRLLDIIEEGSEDAIFNTRGRESLGDFGQYSRRWIVEGMITSDYLTDIERDIPFSCTIYMDGSGNDLDGSVQIDF